MSFWTETLYPVPGKTQVEGCLSAKKKKKNRNSAMELQQAATMGWLFFPFVLLLQHAWEKGTASENCSWENSSSYGENLDFFSEAQE